MKEFVAAMVGGVEVIPSGLKVTIRPQCFCVLGLSIKFLMQGMKYSSSVRLE